MLSSRVAALRLTNPGVLQDRREVKAKSKFMAWIGDQILGSTFILDFIFHGFLYFMISVVQKFHCFEVIAKICIAMKHVL